MVRELSENPSVVKADAGNRSWRTFVAGLLFDVVLAVLIAVGPMLTGDDFAFTRAYWTLVGVAALKTVYGAVASYLGRYLASRGPAGVIGLATRQTRATGF